MLSKERQQRDGVDACKGFCRIDGEEEIQARVDERKCLYHDGDEGAIRIRRGRAPLAPDRIDRKVAKDATRHGEDQKGL